MFKAIWARSAAVNDRWRTVYPKKYAHGFCFAVLCCGYTLTDFPISIRLTSLALWQSNDCPSASKATLMNMDKYFMWIHYERLHDHNKANHNKTVCIFRGIYCIGKVIVYCRHFVFASHMVYVVYKSSLVVSKRLISCWHQAIHRKPALIYTCSLSKIYFNYDIGENALMRKSFFLGRYGNS